MNKSRARIDKENIVPPKPAAKRKALREQKLYYLIVEIQRQAGDSTAQGLSQYWLISSKSIVDIPVINNETVYTGKKLRINNNEGKVVSGTCVLFSPDQAFVEEQFAHITSTTSSSMDKQPKNAPLVLNVSTKENVMSNGTLTNGHGAVASENNAKQNGAGRKFKLPSSITVKSVSGGTTTCQDPDKENESLEVDYVSMESVQLPGRPMMYDQQSQTDSKMFEGVVPATAAQSHQQAQQIAQLIRANNLLVLEMRNLKESNAGMDAKLGKVLEILNNQSTAYVKEESNSVTAAESGQESLVEISIYNENSMDQSIGNSIDINTSRDQSITESVKQENTPPLKKNKQKLRNSLEQAKQAFTVAAGDYTTIGPNNTKVPRDVIQNLNYSNYSSVTRKVLVSVFDRETLATHSLTGKPSPAFLGRDAKMRLDPLKTQDIVEFVKVSCGVQESQIRSVITSKLADENKMLRMNTKKRGYSLDANTTLLNNSMNSPLGGVIKKRRAMDKENLEVLG